MPGAASLASTSTLPSLSTAATSTTTTPMPTSPQTPNSNEADKVAIANGDEKPVVEDAAEESKDENGDPEVSIDFLFGL